MKYKFGKDMHIMVDVLTYCHKLGAEDFNIDVKTSGGVFELSLRCHIENMPDGELEDLRTELGRNRQKEIEQDYWGLSGEVEADCELTLVGMMVDEAKVSYEDGVFAIDIRRLEK